MNRYFEEGDTFLWIKDRDYQSDSLKISLKMIRQVYRKASKQGLIAQDQYSGKKYFVKVIFCDEMDTIYVEKESKVQLHSPFIIRIYGGMLDEKLKRFITLLEYIPECDLSDLMYQKGIAGENWNRKIRTCHKIAMKFLHGIDYYMSLYETDPIIHRDLKPENLMVSPDGAVVKIVDFDWVHLHDSSQTLLNRREQRGTPGYVDPRYWNSFVPSKTMDIYSAGLVLFFLYTGTHHFHENEEIQRQLVGDSYAYTLKNMPGIDGELRRIIAKMIAPEEERYEDIRQVIQDMKAYLKGQEIKILLPELLEEEEEGEAVIRFSYQVGAVIYRPYVKKCRFVPIEIGTRQERSLNGRISAHILSFYRLGDRMKALVLHEDCHPVTVSHPDQVSQGDTYSYAGTQIKVLQIR